MGKRRTAAEVTAARNPEPKYTSFQKWFTTFLKEKGVDLSDYCRAGDGTLLQLGDVASAVMTASANEQAQIKDKLVMIDFKNGDVTHFLKHLARALDESHKVTW